MKKNALATRIWNLRKTGLTFRQISSRFRFPGTDRARNLSGRGERLERYASRGKPIQLAVASIRSHSVTVPIRIISLPTVLVLPPGLPARERELAARIGHDWRE